jgi:hypothetical protein
MPRPIKIKIDVSKIDKAALYKGAKGTYLDCVAWPSKTTGQYGDTHYIVQELSREKRDAGEKGAIIGNMTVPDDEQPRQEVRPVQRQQKMDQAFPAGGDEDNIPF